MAYNNALRNKWLDDYVWFEKQFRWTFYDCYKEALKYSSVKSFRKESHAAYTASIKYKWIEKFDWLERTRQNNGYWNKERCYEEAKKYKSRGGFAKGSQSAYNVANKNGWLDDYTWFSESASAKKWDYETCLEESKRYKTKTEFHDGSNSAYSVACRNKWLDEYTWLEDGNQKRIIWTYEACYQEALKYKTRSEFAKANQSAYNRARINGWLEEYAWLPKPKVWTYEEVYELAKQFEYKVDFYRNNCGAYDTALRNGWIKDYYWFLDGIKRTGEKHRKWDYETCYKEAMKYKSRGAFGTTSQRAYYIALQNNWLDDYTWLEDERFDLFTDKIDSVYCYEFENQKAVYVGRTLMRLQKQRDYQHIFTEDSVSLFAKENCTSIPEMKILEEGLTIKEGSLKEGLWLEKYKNEGWVVLNRIKTGSIGGLGKGKWNYNSCKELAEECESIKEFKTKSMSAYNKARLEGWLKDYYWLENDIKFRKDYYTYVKCFEIAIKYKKLTDFRKKHNGAYTTAKENDWLKDYTWLEKQFKWTEDTILEEAKKYKTRSDFAKAKPGAYEYAIKHSLLNKCVWFEESKKPNGYWTYEKCLEESKKYNYRGDYRKGSNGSYKVAIRNGWIDDFVWLLKQKPNIRRIWTEENCRNEALKYKSVSEFKKGNKSAYKAATRYKWLKDYQWLKRENGKLDLFD